MSIPVPFNILTMFPDRLKESRLILVPYTPDSLVVRTLYGESIDRALTGTYIPRGAENCPGHCIALACYYQIADLSKALDPVNSFDIPSSFLCRRERAEGVSIISRGLRYERSLAQSRLMQPTSRQSHSFTLVTQRWWRRQHSPNYDAVKATAADLQRLWAQLLALKDSIRGAAPNCKHTSTCLSQTRHQLSRG